jgi:hypothetical protein
MVTTPFDRRESRALFLCALIAIAASCAFSPQVESGVQSCGTGDACPTGLVCSATGRCCTPGDEQARCTGHAPGKTDAGAPDKAQPTTGDDEPKLAADAAASADVTNGAEAGPLKLPRVVRVTDFPSDLATVTDNCSKTPAVNGVVPERWCAFVHQTDLWVVNISRVVKTTVKCDGSDPSCLRLTTKLYRDVEDPSAYVNPTFWGDLLIFSAEPTSAPADPFRGGVFAWMTGWTAPKRLTSSNGVKCRACNADDRAWGTAVSCLDSPTPQGDVDVLVAPTPMAPLTKVTRQRYIDERMTSLSNDGTYFAYLVAGPAGKRLFLTTVKDAADPTKQTEIADDVALWQMSTDGGGLYVLRDSGRLSQINFSQPTMPIDLAVRISAFGVLVADDYAGNGIWAWQDPQNDSGVLKVFFSRTSPKELDLGRAYSVAAFSGDRRFSLLHTNWSTATGNGNVVAVNNTTLERCTLQAKLNSFFYSTAGFSTDGSWAMWFEAVSANFDDLWIGHPDGCNDVHRVAHATSTVYMDKRGLLYIDEATELRKGRLQYLAWAPGGAWPDRPPVMLHPSVDIFEWPGPGESIVPFISVDPVLGGFYVVEIPQQ